MKGNTRAIIARDSVYHRNVLGLVTILGAVNAAFIAAALYLKLSVPSAADGNLIYTASKWFLISLTTCCVVYIHVKSNYDKYIKLVGLRSSVYFESLSGVKLFRANVLEISLFVISFLVLSFALWTGLLLFIMSFMES